MNKSAYTGDVWWANLLTYVIQLEYHKIKQIYEKLINF